VSGIAALKGYSHANKEMMDLWSSVYEGDLGTALTDTFGTDAFLADFTTKYAKLFDSVRHDSGDPFEYTDKIVAHYKKLRIDPMSKTIIFSNALTTDLALEIVEYCRGKIKCVPAIGTHFTNDVGVKALNIVIKLASIDGLPCIKLSDDAGKSVGDGDTVKFVKWHLKIPDPAPQPVTV
jgi:nicotinate phosphoribosyltransferase